MQGIHAAVANKLFGTVYRFLTQFWRDTCRLVATKFSKAINGNEWICQIWSLVKVLKSYHHVGNLKDAQRELYIMKNTEYGRK